MGNVDGGAMSCGRGSHGHRVAGEGSPATTPETTGPAGGVPLPTPGGTAPVYDVGGMADGVTDLADLDLVWWIETDDA